MDYTSLLNSAKRTISEVAHDIAASQFRKDVLPGKEQIIREAQERLAKNQDVSSGLKNAGNYMINLMSSATGDPDYTGGIKRMLRSEDDINAVVDSQLRILKSRKIDSTILNDKTINSVKRQMHKMYQEGMRLAKASPMDGEFIYQELDTVDKAGQLVQTYFKNPDEKVRTNRILAAAGAYGVGAVGARFMSGGTLSVDRYGRSDVVGIPFV